MRRLCQLQSRVGSVRRHFFSLAIVMFVRHGSVVFFSSDWLGIRLPRCCVMFFFLTLILNLVWLRLILFHFVIESGEGFGPKERICEF